MLGLVVGYRQLGLNQLDLNPVSFFDPLTQDERLRKLIARFEVKDVYRRFDLGEHVENAAAFGPKCGRHGEARKKGVHRPGQNLPRRCFLKFLVYCPKLWSRAYLNSHGSYLNSTLCLSS